MTLGGLLNEREAKKEKRGERRVRKGCKSHKEKGRGNKGDGVEAVRRRRQADPGQEERFQAKKTSW